MIEKRPGRPSAQGAVRKHLIAVLTEREMPTPTDRALRDWMREGTVPNIASVGAVSELLLRQCSEASTLLGRGKDRADRVRVVLAVRGYDINPETLRSDAVSSLLDFGGISDALDDRESVDQVSAIATKLLDEWVTGRGNERLRPLVNAVNVVAVNKLDEPGETAVTMSRHLVQNVVSSALGEGLIEPKPLAHAVAVMLELSPSETDELAEHLQRVLEPGWNRIIDLARTGPIDDILTVARTLRTMGAGTIAVRVAGGKTAHPTHADYMCFVSALYMHAMNATT